MKLFPKLNIEVVKKNSYFVYLWNSQVLSQLTIHIMNFVLLIDIYAKTGSTIATSLLWVSFAFPALIFGPIGAALVDMVDKRKMLMYSNLAQALVVFTYGFIHTGNVFLPYFVVLLYSLLNQFYTPAEAATVPSVVQKKYLPQANGLFFLTQQGAMIVGFGIAGLLHNSLGFERTILLSSVLLFLAFLSVSYLPKMKARNKLPSDFEEAFVKFFKNLVAGYEFIKNNNMVLAPFGLLIMMLMGSYMLIINIPVIADQIFRVNLYNSGVYIVVPVAVGALISSIRVPRQLRSGTRKKRIIESALLGLVISLLVLIFVVPYLSFFYIRTVVSVLSLMAVGASFIGTYIPCQTLLQEFTPGGLRGRVFGNFWFVSTIVTALPVLFSGALVELFGIRFLLMLLLAMILSILSFIRIKGDKFAKVGFDFKKL